MWLVQNSKAISWNPRTRGWRICHQTQSVLSPGEQRPLYTSKLFSFKAEMCAHIRLSVLEIAGHVIFSVWIGWGKWEANNKFLAAKGRQATERKGEKLSGAVEESFDSCDIFAIFLQFSECCLQAWYFLNKQKVGGNSTNEETGSHLIFYLFPWPLPQPYF